ncbi:MAG: PAS domain-containing protein [Desulfobacterales bacterium]
MRNESSVNSASISFEDVCDLAAIVESAHNGIVLVDRSGKILVFNRAALGMVNIRGQEVLGRNIQDVFPEVWADMQQIVETGIPQLARQVTINGKDIIANRTPIWRAGEVSGVLSIFQDIFEYEKVLAELESYKQLNEEMDVIINSSYDGLWICGPCALPGWIPVF